MTLKEFRTLALSERSFSNIAGFPNSISACLKQRFPKKKYCQIGAVSFLNKLEDDWLYWDDSFSFIVAV